MTDMNRYQPDWPGDYTVGVFAPSEAGKAAKVTLFDVGSEEVTADQAAALASALLAAAGPNAAPELLEANARAEAAEVSAGQAFAEADALRARAEKAEEERDAEINRAHTHLEKRKAAERERDEAIARASLAEKRIAAVLALTGEDFAKHRWDRVISACGRNPQEPGWRWEEVVPVEARPMMQGEWLGAVLDLIRSRATEGAEDPTGAAT